MHDMRHVLARLQTLRGKFEGLLASAHKKAARAPDDRPTGLRELTGFGSNPGNLRMFAYAPPHLPRKAPLVVALHGCTQTAEDYDRGSGWSSLADRLGFAVVYPQQQPANNPKSCFTWFLPGDITRGQGEALSIKQMVEHAIATFAADRSKVFVTGLSAGGAMACVMLATYPEVFAGGAIIAGLPYGCAGNAQQAFEAMFAERGHGAQALGDRVRGASGCRGPWPKISVWHGAGDPIVKPSNCEDIIRQWTNVHGLSDSPSYRESIGSHSRRVWSDAKGNALIEAVSIAGMAHGVPLATATGAESCGAAGAFFLDVGISSTHQITRFWGLEESLGEQPRTAAPAPQVSAEASVAEGEERQSHAPDPNDVIAAAFKAAGLSVPPQTSSGATRRADPGSIIAAALKAAGLAQR
ncbi:MAG: PHB depolymerase family esterase [Hyphomicrobiales bacterium]|nr:PHB depolymerase family esterase [Hyphomicrobiales bacterium]